MTQLKSSDEDTRYTHTQSARMATEGSYTEANIVCTRYAQMLRINYFVQASYHHRVRIVSRRRLTFDFVEGIPCVPWCVRVFEELKNVQQSSAVSFLYPAWREGPNLGSSDCSFRNQNSRAEGWSVRELILVTGPISHRTSCCGSLPKIEISSSARPPCGRTFFERPVVVSFV